MKTTPSTKPHKSVKKAAASRAGSAGRNTRTDTRPASGSAAPAFSLPADTGGPVSLADHKGKWVVVFFYPRDNTPGCTREAIGFEKAAAALKQRGAVVLGVSRDSIASHCNFKEKQGLRFPLLSDPTAEVHKRYGAFGDKMMYGKKVTGTIRTTALIRPDGKLARLFSNVKVDGHVDTVLAAIDEEKKAFMPSARG
jgi:thioredoxin-dependent peroxiredoxin